MSANVCEGPRTRSFLNEETIFMLKYDRQILGISQMMSVA